MTSIRSQQVIRRRNSSPPAEIQERKMISNSNLSKTQTKKSSPGSSDYVVPQPPVKPPKDKAAKQKKNKEPRGIKAFLLNMIERKIKQYSKF